MVHTPGGSVIYVSIKFEADSSIRSKVIKEVPKFGIRSRDPGHAHLGVVLWPYAGRLVLYVCTEFEADCSFHSKVIGGS